ncbi:hypothetical protein EIP86_007882 [Pleurotus ostreatoroseus]|nr:hypothetical protein EIP86_007882 [Pleurotus ostreatoroseus]
MAAISPKDVKSLSIQAVVFASMCGLSGVYFTLFVLAIVSTLRKNDRASKNLRKVTIALFLVLSTHFTCRCLDFSRARIVPQPADERFEWMTPLLFIESLCTRTVGTISDGLLAYRFWVIFNKKRWALFIPMTAIGITACKISTPKSTTQPVLTTDDAAVLGLAASASTLAVYRHKGDAAWANRVSVVMLKMGAAWGWSMFAINTTLTTSILVKILRVARSSKAMSYTHKKMPYASALEAIVESALVTWIGLLFYEVTALAPEGHYTNDLNVGTVAICILPFFFGISQCLITVRLSLLGLDGAKAAPRPGVVLIESYTTSVTDRPPRDTVFSSQTASSGTVVTDSEKDGIPESKGVLSFA